LIKKFKKQVQNVIRETGGTSESNLIQTARAYLRGDESEPKGDKKTLNTKLKEEEEEEKLKLFIIISKPINS